MPILDIQAWIKQVETGSKMFKNQIYYEFYEKTMSSKFVIKIPDLERFCGPFQSREDCSYTGRYQKTQKLQNRNGLV